MDSILSIGEASGNLAHKIIESANDQHRPSLYKFSETKKGRNTFCLGAVRDMEHAEERAISQSRKIKKFLSDSGPNVLFVLVGSTDISGASLSILEHLKERNVHILYVQPDLELLDGPKRKKEKVTFQILQEMTRSGLFERMFIVNNNNMHNIVLDVPAALFWEKINEGISQMFRLVTHYSSGDAILGSKKALTDAEKISTFGVVNFDSLDESLVFDMSEITSKEYYYVVNKELLEKDGSLVRQISDSIKQKIKSGGVGISYSIFSSDFEGTQVYCRVTTDRVQSTALID